MNKHRFQLFCTLALLFFTHSASAETLIIQADKSASANQQPIILQTANGLPQVNIQTPNAGGLSHNKYSQFDVDNRGAILNNSRLEAQTQLAGMVTGNPYLARGEAKIILNEVNSSDPSQLKGYVEVAGKKAEVIIANPSGIHCQGCGVINASRATLSTGKPLLQDGKLTGFNVEKGAVQVSGKGLDNRQADYTEILAREAQINAGIWADKKLTVVTGKNQIQRDEQNVDALQIIHQPSAQNLAQNSPQFALDVSALGGMYAGSIQLVGTEQGLGVRNAGHIGAQSGEVQIDSAGRIVNQGKIQAKQDIELKARQQIHNQAKANIVAQQGSVQLNTAKQLEQQGSIGAKTAVKITAVSLNQQASGEIQAGDVQIALEQKLSNRGLINSQQEQPERATTLIRAAQIENLGTGRIYGDFVTLGAEHLENRDELSDNGAVRHDPVIAARNRLSIGAKQILNQTQHYVANQKGAATLYGEKEIHLGGELNVQQQVVGRANQLRNLSGNIEAANGSIAIQAQQLENHNLHFHAQVENQSDKAINETYVIPKGYKTSERIAYSELKWVPFSRSRKLAFRDEKIENFAPFHLGQPITGNTLLPSVNEYSCSDYNQPNSCSLKPESVYGADHPAWAYFNLTPPTEMPQNLPQITPPEEPVAPSAPAPLEAKREFESQAEFQLRAQAHKLDQAEYERAQQTYLNQKADYERNLAAYQQAMAPFNAWLQQNEQAFKALSDKISQHNKRITGRRFDAFTFTYLTRRVKDLSVVKTSLPGQILAAGDIAISGESISNDRSQMIAGGNLDLSGNVDNQDETGHDILKEYGTSQYTWDKWRGGRRRYFQRYWDSVKSYNNYVDTPFQMGVAVRESQTDYKQNQATQAASIEPKQALALLPSASLYKLNPDSSNRPLVEIDPAFANRKQWLSSDYMYNALRHDHQNVHKRLGDGYYEQQLVRAQITQLTGKILRENYRSFDEQYKQLMDNGISFAQKFHLRPGIALSKAQVAQLTSDIVWFEPQSIRLADGRALQVLVPKVYLVPQAGEQFYLNADGGLLSANQIRIQGTEVNNSATIAG